MPVTEFATLEFKESYNIADDDVRKHFRDLASLQSSWSHYPITYYADLKNPAILYLLSGWEDVPAHTRWIESDTNQSLLKIFEPILTITDFAHVDIDFREFPVADQLLAFRKETGHNEADLPVSLDPIEDHFGGMKSWSREGRGVERLQDHYYFATYYNLGQSRINDPGYWRLMRPIEFK